MPRSMSRCSTPLPLPSANSRSCVRSPIDLEAHGNRSRALERFETRALQLSGQVLGADDGAFAVQRAADHGNRDRRHEETE